MGLFGKSEAQVARELRMADTLEAVRRVCEKVERALDILPGMLPAAGKGKPGLGEALGSIVSAFGERRSNGVLASHEEE